MNDFIMTIVDLVRIILLVWLFCRVAPVWAYDKPVTNRWIVGTFMLILLLLKL